MLDMHDGDPGAPGSAHEVGDSVENQAFLVGAFDEPDLHVDHQQGRPHGPIVVRDQYSA